jgi:hypothetical protein
VFGDNPMINLSNTTLISICDDAYLKKTSLSIQYCLKKAKFFDVQILKIDDLDDIKYAQICVEKLYGIIKSDFCLIVQWDGFIINEHLWNDEFLNYDYIGAPWGFPDDCRNRVGNGGFSLRSRKFLRLSSTIKYKPFNYEMYTPLQIYDKPIAPEDWFLCYGNYYYLVDNGVKFPSMDLAYSFSMEYQSAKNTSFNKDNISTYNSFGFHGHFNTGAMKLLEENNDKI